MLPAIEVKQVCKHFGNLRALTDIDLEIHAGEFFALLGPNGAGKTTLISIIAGLTLANKGSVHVMGHDVRTQYQQARRNLGVVPQELVFDPFFTVREVLLIQSGYYGIKENARWVDEIIERLDLSDKANANMRALSGGMKRRVLVAQALVHKPPVIILDEPTAGVDVELRQTLWDFIKQLNQDGHTIVLTTHYLEEAETLCHRVAMLKEGQIVALDSTQNLIGKMIAGKSVRLRLVPDKLPPTLRPLQISHHDGIAELKIENYAQVEFILSSLRTADIQILEMHLQQPDLEDVFVSIMRNSGNQSK
ncbi:MAG: ABC transporter ATP-binding protein [Nitrosomonas sp.]|uniref:ABC transporter ATP-binding protein n=1 Tax=Nitrosomonas sp. TaxID=42353 RepID=UPI0027176938|nr:ABC transporter ATP-binding protein [Nitrosomonas sp.]MDO9470764.1 ABC transporter ATP-binding protein [Nitrosomonas sp.]MDP3280465.1 ABC transporter ATP-binding protein [Nitrosomonas sp.]MDP3664869.1 ABC transporter ATP-binding protein [Nitrosomonas sp.]MDZ4107630.1 ABC transporter ATP-binding protein [Nitrosomonas sp.]